MKIKNCNFIYILVTAFAVGSMSCAKLLDVPPQNKLVLNEFWLSKGQAIGAVAGIYSNLGSTKLITGTNPTTATSISPVESYIYWGEMRGELLKSSPGKLPSAEVTKENVDNFIVTPNDVTTKYTQFYKIINGANQAIKNIPGIMAKDPTFTQTDADNLTGEAYFLRGYAYFWLVRAFKEVPLMLEPSQTDNQDYNLPKSSSDEIFAQIVSDLERAKQTLPEWYTNNQYAHCRATIYTAATTLADVYLTMAAMSNDPSLKSTYYQKAIDDCDLVINSGRYFLIHGSILGTVWSVGGTGESIFENFSSSTLNNQTNNLKLWFTDNIYFVVTTSIDALFLDPIRDYRGALVPTGPVPPSGIVFSYVASSGVISKYLKSTRDAIWNFYRYPEVLLMKAEALAHLVPDNAENLVMAADLVNQLRARAYGITLYTKVLPSSTLGMDNLILNERGREFLAEGKRWFELVRFASRDNFANPELLIERIVQSYSGTFQMIIRPRITNPESWYLPLNADALSSNPNLIQNSYYQ